MKKATAAKDSLYQVEREIIVCARCPRLVTYRENVALHKRRAYQGWTYWGRPVPGFGDPQARLLIIGLAPAAHGGNRTGRVFTGDSSGDLLFRTLYETGFANQPQSVSRDDGMRLTDAYIAATVRCAPPGNKPLPEESFHCREYLERELALLKRLRVVVALGKIAFEAYLTILLRQGRITSRSEYKFAHGATHRLPAPLPTLIASYHPSRQNTQTGKLTSGMFLSVFRKARALLE
jgi:uracil-DNA glycosylase family 4